MRKSMERKVPGMGKGWKGALAAPRFAFLAALLRPAARSRSSSARAMAAARGVSNAAVEFFLSIV